MGNSLGLPTVVQGKDTKASKPVLLVWLSRLKGSALELRIH